MNLERCTYEKLFKIEAQGSQADYDPELATEYPEETLADNSRMLVHDGEPIAAFGIWPMPAGVGAGWMLFSEYGATMFPLAISRHVKLELEKVVRNYSRIISVVDINEEAAVRWAEWLKFERMKPIVGMESKGYYEYMRIEGCLY